ncbi:MAG TPA: hypothetical protein VEZ90_12140 [Blastocatellia bacterium]|nr:hypothetical protein [Blastocatellia bacterium]
MNKHATVNFNVGDDIAYAMPSGMLYGTVLRVLGDGDSQAIEIQFEDGRKEIKKARDRALSLLKRASGASEKEEMQRGKDRLKDFDIERVRRSDTHRGR